MASRPVLFLGVLAAAVAVPYVLLDKNLSQTAKAQYERVAGRFRGAGGSTAASDPALSTVAVDANQAIAPAAAEATLEEAFRFDVTPQWVTTRWPRVSTVQGDLEQLGMRVAYASGTRPDDVAGSLTYYFDKHHQLQRITFVGITGDHRRLMAVLLGGFRLKSQPTTGVAHYIAGDPEKPTSSVSVRHLPIVRADAEHARAEIQVDLRRADTANWTSAAAQEEAPADSKFLPTSYRRW